MSMRLKTTLLIILIVFVSTTTTFLSGLYFTNDSLRTTMEQDMTFAIGIANSLVGLQMNLKKSEAAVIAARVAAATSDQETETLLKAQINAFPGIEALSVFDRNRIIASYSVPAHDHELAVRSEYIEMVYAGGTIISSPFYCSVKGEFVMNIYTPLSYGKILAMSIPGQTFSDMLAKHRLWRNGHIFMINEEGTFVGAADRDPVLAMNHGSAANGEAPDPHYAEMRALIRKILSTDSGVDSYHFEDREHLCAYSRIDDSLMGWRVAVTVPLAESPQADAMRGQTQAAVFFLIAGAVVAFFLSRLTAQPYRRIEIQNRDLAKLNETIRAQAASLLEEHERVKVMLDATPLASRLWDRSFRMIACNEAAVKLFHLKDKQEYLDRYFDLTPEYQPDGQTTRDKIIMLISEAFETGVCSYELMYRMLDGTLVPTESTLVRVPYGDDYVVAAYSRDLREQQAMMAEMKQHDALLQTVNQALELALADAKEANNAKSSFLAQMSHEIRTPLNAVIGLSELTLNEENLSREAGSNLEKIYNAGSTILSIVNDILDISKIESGKFELTPVQYDIPSLINDTVTLNIVRIGEKIISFKLHVDENLPGALYGDDLRVKQIFNNLLSNAFKYTNSGTVTWRVSFERDGENVWLVSSIQDTGIGIKPEDVQRLFADYNQVDIKTNRRVGGTGLGLAIAKRLVDMMDGTLSLESEYGKGSTFTVRLRQILASEAPIGKEIAKNLMDLRYTLSKRSQNTKLARVDLSYAHVLVVDDIETNLDVARGMMKPYAMRIDCATSGQQAIAMIRAENPRYDAVFMDHMMPGMDGVEAARIIREEIDTDYARSVPIVALTANAIVGNEEMFLSQGFQAFLPKPIDIAKLDSILRHWVRDKTREKKPADAHPEDESPLLDGITIAGVNKNKALERFSGNATVFINVLRSYAANTPPLLRKLRDYLAAENIAEYAIAVHGLKGASYTISAQDTGKAAEELELAAKAGDFAAVKAGHGSLEKNAQALLGAIAEALAALDAETSKSSAPEPAPEQLRELRAACEALDMDRVDAAMERLESFRYEKGGGLVAWLREQIDAMAFENVSHGAWPPE